MLYVKPAWSIWVLAGLFLLAGVGDAAAQTEGELLRLSKRASKSTVQRGDIVTYTVELENLSDQDIGTESGPEGIVIDDLIPDGFSYVPGTARFETTGGLSLPAHEPGRGTYVLTFGMDGPADADTGEIQAAGVPLAGGATLRLIYQLSVGGSASPDRDYANLAQARELGGLTQTSNVASATVRLTREAELEESLVVGKVFCDDDGDGEQSEGERGLGGVRVYADHGWYADTDATGKWHLKKLLPGNHLFKVDEATLPPGSEPTGSLKALLYLTPGLVAKASFGVSCRFETVGPTSYELAPAEGVEDDGRVLLPTGRLPVVTIGGRRDTFELFVDGKPVPMPSAELTLKPPTDKFEMDAGKDRRNIRWTPRPLSDPLVFGIEASVPDPTRSTWQLGIFLVSRPSGHETVVREFFGKGTPPETIKWDGTDPETGFSILERGAFYRVRLRVADGFGNVAEGAEAAFGVSLGDKRPPIHYAEVTGPLFAAGWRPTWTLIKELRLLREYFADNPGARLLLELDVAPGALAAEDLLQTRRAAVDLVPIAARELKVEPDQVITMGYGSARAEDAEIPTGQAHVELSVLPPFDRGLLKRPPLRRPAPRVTVGSVGVEVADDGSFAQALKRPADGQVVVHVTRDTGSSLTALLDVGKGPGAAPPAGEKKPLPVERPPGLDPEIDSPHSWNDPFEGSQLVGFAAGPEVWLSVAGPDLEKPPGEKPTAEKPAATAEALAPFEEKKKPTQPLSTDPLRRFGGSVLRKSLGSKVILPGDGSLGHIQASELSVSLPPKGLEIGTNRLHIPGKTHPGNRITINGTPVAVSAAGEFAQTVDLPVGSSTLTIVSTDPRGNTATIEWPVEVSDSEFFLLLLADGALGQVDAKLAEGTPETSWEKGRIFLQGRGALYLKGRVSGTKLAKDIFYTAHVDSAKRPYFESFYDQVIDPARDYAIFGDASNEVQDARARGPVYVLVQADRSTLELGSFHTDMKGIELLRYERSFYGAKLDFDKAFAPGWDTKLKAFATEDNQRLVRGHDELRATGGSLYYLSQRDVIPGSEKITIVVRELETGMELARTQVARDRDYRVDYPDGRVSFKGPISSTIDALFTIGNAQPFPARELLDGHQVWIVVDYESRSRSAGGDVAFGVGGSQLFGGVVEVGANYVQEDRQVGDKYKLYGAHAKVHASKETELSVEVARAESTDGASQISTDGGLSYQALDRSADGDDDGRAIKVAARSDVGELVGAEGLDLQVAAHYQVMETGFHTSGNVQEQGQQKWGGSAVYRPTDDDRIALRADGGRALLIDPRFSEGYRWRDYRRYAGQYRRTLGDGYLHVDGYGGQHQDQLDGKVYNTGAFALGGGYRLTDDLELSISQEAIIAGEAAIVGSETTDRLTTNIGAIYRLTDDMALVARESVRWNGDNATRLGVRSKVGEKSSLYLEERLLDTEERGELAHATVVGGETRFGDKDSGRAYSEYHLDSGVGGQTNRAVLGIGQRFELAPGVGVSVGYEHTRSFGGYEGKMARDVVSTGVELLGNDFFKFGGRYELRWDRGDESAGGSEKIQVLLLNGLDIKLTRDLTLLGVANYAFTQNLTNRYVDREAIEATAGLAYRPIDFDWALLLLRYSHRLDRRVAPLASLLDDATDRQGTERTAIHLASLAGVFDLPYRFQLTEKVAWKRSREFAEGLESTTGDYLIWINRLGFRFIDDFEVAAEYRLMTALLDEDLTHGALFEVAYVFADYVRLGAGYNFTDFSDDLMEQRSEKAGGFFMRLTGMY